MTDLSVDDDRFAVGLENMLDGIRLNIEDGLPNAMRAAAKFGAKSWRENARSVFRDGKVYKKGGKTYTVGEYAKSVRSHLLSRDRHSAMAEIGVPRMAGLVHLLEDGHAIPGGGVVKGRPHVVYARKDAYEAAELMVGLLVDEALS